MPTSKTSGRTTDKADPAVVAARNQQAATMQARAVEARQDARKARLRAANPDDLLTEDDAVEAETRATEAEALAEKVKAAAPSPNAEIERKVRAAQVEANKELVTRWKRERAIHYDLATNPDAYGGVDLGGAPIDVDAQMQMVYDLDAAIAAALEA